MSQSWDEREIRLTIDAYFDMLRMELAGESFVKKRIVEALTEQIDRSSGAVEYKFANVSAALRDVRAPYVNGYKPRQNRQKALDDAVVEQWESDDRTRRLAHEWLTGWAPHTPVDLRWEDADSEAPVIELSDGLWRTMSAARRTDYVEVDARNRSLGLAGERSVVTLEQVRLARAGREDLARRVEHVAQTQGDGLGFDVASFDVDGAERFIEVKTTRLGRDWPFYVSRNEVAVSSDLHGSYHLYRLYRFGAADQNFYVLPGSLGETCALQPVSYEAAPRSA